jgi:hypothetical protein
MWCCHLTRLLPLSLSLSLSLSCARALSLAQLYTYDSESPPSPNAEQLLAIALRSAGCREIVVPLCELPALFVRAQHGHTRCVDRLAVRCHVLGHNCETTLLNASLVGADRCRSVDGGRVGVERLPYAPCAGRGALTGSDN